MKVVKAISAWMDGRLAGRLRTGLPYPRIVSIEPVSNACQLRCPLCPTGAQRHDYERLIMPLETFRTILDKMPFIRVINLYKSGEPFLNPDIFAMVRHAADRGIKVIISTNLSYSKPEDFFAKVVGSGLYRLVVSLDGASRESYEKYRIGGDFELVMANLRKLVEARQEQHGKSPEIVWQFLVNRFNENEIDAARALADRLKVTLDVRPMAMSDDVPDVELAGTIEERKEYWLGVDRKYICDRYLRAVCFPLYQEACPHLFTRVVITADGKVLPCCETWSRNSVMGDLLAESFEEIWNNRKFSDARSQFLDKNFVPTTETVCRRCKNYGARYSLREKLGLLKTVYVAQLAHLGKT